MMWLLHLLFLGHDAQVENLLCTTNKHKHFKACLDVSLWLTEDLEVILPFVPVGVFVEAREIEHFIL